MGAGGQKHAMHEIDETRASVRDDEFQAIVDKIKMVAEEFEDETHPLYIDLGEEEFEYLKGRRDPFLLSFLIAPNIIIGGDTAKYLSFV